MTALRTLFSLGALAVLCVTAGPAQDKKTEMIPVKYDGLKEAVLRQRGKVVLVDFWAGY